MMSELDVNNNQILDSEDLRIAIERAQKDIEENPNSDFESKGSVMELMLISGLADVCENFNYNEAAIAGLKEEQSRLLEKRSKGHELFRDNQKIEITQQVIEHREGIKQQFGEMFEPLLSDSLTRQLKDVASGGYRAQLESYSDEQWRIFAEGIIQEDRLSPGMSDDPAILTEQLRDRNIEERLPRLEALSEVFSEGVDIREVDEEAFCSVMAPPYLFQVESEQDTRPI